MNGGGVKREGEGGIEGETGTNTNRQTDRQAGNYKILPGVVSSTNSHTVNAAGDSDHDTDVTIQ